MRRIGSLDCELDPREGGNVSFFYRRRDANWPSTVGMAERGALVSWWDLHSAAAAFGLAAGYTRSDVEVAFRRLALKAHPDAGGTQDAFQSLVSQRDLLLSQAEK